MVHLIVIVPTLTTVDDQGHPMLEKYFKPGTTIVLRCLVTNYRPDFPAPVWKSSHGLVTDSEKNRWKLILKINCRFKWIKIPLSKINPWLSLMSKDSRFMNNKDIGMHLTHWPTLESRRNMVAMGLWSLASTWQELTGQMLAPTLAWCQECKEWILPPSTSASLKVATLIIN